MKQLIAILALSVSVLCTKAQSFLPDYPQNHLYIGMGGGPATGGGIVNLQLGYNINYWQILYSQTVYPSPSKPAIFEMKGGYELRLGDHGIMPTVGYAYLLQSVDGSGNHSSHISYGGEYDWHINSLLDADPRFFVNYNRVGSLNLFAIGLKASF